ncbi:MAG: hypothetical protein MUF13_13855 [Akkermansiaceae bacterium]|nr:hypothetical protein [Akkermansiaceae bacterium]
MKAKYLQSLFTIRSQSSRSSSAIPASLSFSKHPAAAVALLALFAALPSGRAADFTWNGTSNAYGDNASWLDGVAPGNAGSSSTDNAIFSNLGSADFVSPTLPGSRSLQTLTFTADARAYTFGGSGTLSIRAAFPFLTNNSAATQTFNLPITIINGSSQITNTQATGALVFNGGLNISHATANRVVTFAGLGSITHAGVIANGGSSTASGVTVTSTGATIFGGNNTYDGTTTMNATGGVLSLNGDNSGADGAVTITAGTVKLGHSSALGSGIGATSVASKPWHYLLVPHTAVNESQTVTGLAAQYTVKAE